MLNRHCLLVLVPVVLSGCATYTGWEPVVDTYDDPNAYRLQQDIAEFKMLAHQAGSTGMETAKGAAAGALFGAAAGAAIGAVAGNLGGGAAIGAAVGGLGGSGYTGLSGEDQYKRAYINCLRNWGHQVIN